jgi:ornithine--oxo-acid transaminase
MPEPLILPLTATSAVVSNLVTLYQDHVNPQWVRLLNALDMNVRYTRCLGTELYTEDGRRILDFLSGYCVHNAGHNHPGIIAAIKEELDHCGPAMLQSHVPELAGELAEKLCTLAGGRLKKAFFCCSGTEGVEAAIKFSRATTGRTGLIYSDGASHGLTCGALSLMSNPFWREGFGPLLADNEEVPFGDAAALEEKLATKRFAAFIVEPVQTEGGIRLAPPGYLEAAQNACRRHGALLVVDEAQTGLFRTGAFLAAHHHRIDPDIVVLAKALSGGLIPCAAVLMSDHVYNAVYGSLKRAIVHTSTFSENGLSMRVGLATLDVLQRERLGQRAAEMGEYMRERLRARLSGYEMVKEVRGSGLLNGIEFGAPQKLSLRVPFEAFLKIHPAMFGQVLVMRLFRLGLLTQICSNNFMTLRLCPPLVVEEGQVDELVDAVASVVELMHSSNAYWTEALGLARRVLGI